MNIKRLFFTLLTVALLLRAAVYVQSCLNIPVTTDEAITVLQGKRILEGEPQWLMYAQPYMIPFEAYLMAPLTVLPRTTWAMRSLVVMEGILLTTLLLFLVYKAAGGLHKAVAAGLLVLFPSSYIVLNTFGYSFPHNNSALLLSLFAVTLMMTYAGRSLKQRLIWLLLIGLFAGLAFSNAMLSMVLCVPVGIVMIFNGPLKMLPVRVLCMGAGAYLGLFPYRYTLRTFEGAHSGVSESRSLIDTWNVFRSHLMDSTLPRVLGFGPPAFPDESVYPLQLEAALPWIGRLVYLIAFVWMVWRVVVHIRSILNREMPTLGLPDFIIGVWLANLIAYSSSSRSSSTDFRYLMPMVVISPLAIAVVSRHTNRLGHLLLLIASSLWALWNIAAMVMMMRTWSEPNFAKEKLGLPDLGPAISHVQNLGISHAYAQHWTAYRINFITDEKLLTSQPYNARFPSWNLPYKSTVDAADRKAYILTERNRFLTPSALRDHMKRMDMSATSTQLGDYEIFTSFVTPTFMQGMKKVDPTHFISIDAEDFREGYEEVWTDLNLFTKRHSRKLQYEGMHITVTLDEPKTLSLLRINHGFWKADSSPALKLEALTINGWEVITERGNLHMDPFSFRNQHPIYGGIVRRLGFAPTRTKALRITLLDPNPKVAWTLSELELYYLEDVIPEPEARLPVHKPDQP